MHLINNVRCGISPSRAVMSNWTPAESEPAVAQLVVEWDAYLPTPLLQISGFHTSGFQGILGINTMHTYLLLHIVLKYQLKNSSYEVLYCCCRRQYHRHMTDDVICL